MKNQTYREFAKDHEGIPPATLRLFYEMLTRLDRNQQEAERRHAENMAKWQKDSEAAEKRHKAEMAEADRKHAENMAKWQKNSEAADERHKAEMAKWREDSEAAEKRASNFRSEWGAYTEDESDMLEAQVAAAIRANKKIGRMKPNYVNVDMPAADKAQFDIVCMNGKEAKLLEVKRTLTKRDVRAFLARMPVFAEVYAPLVKGKRITGAVVFQTMRSKAGIRMALESGLQVFRADGEKTLQQLTTPPQ